MPNADARLSRRAGGSCALLTRITDRTTSAVPMSSLCTGCRRPCLTTRSTSISGPSHPNGDGARPLRRRPTKLRTSSHTRRTAEGSRSLSLVNRCRYSAASSFTDSGANTILIGRHPSIDQIEVLFRPLIVL